MGRQAEAHSRKEVPRLERPGLVGLVLGLRVECGVRVQGVDAAILEPKREAHTEHLLFKRKGGGPLRVTESKGDSCVWPPRRARDFGTGRGYGHPGIKKRGADRTCPQDKKEKRDPRRGAEIKRGLLCSAPARNVGVHALSHRHCSHQCSTVYHTDTAVKIVLYHRHSSQNSTASH